MQSLVSPSLYPPDLRRKISHLTPLAIEIANRWALGWPKIVKALIAEGEYLYALKAQEREERRVLLIPAPDLNHLARHEIVLEYGLSLAPPSPSSLEFLEEEPYETSDPNAPPRRGLFD
ncbi:MAG: hypothetical protein RR326_00670 [Stenotrophomonas sp.]